MYIIVHEVVAVLEVLALADAVRRDEEIDVGCLSRAGSVPEGGAILGERREAGQDLVEVRRHAPGGRLHRAGACDERGREVFFLHELRRELLVEVGRRVGKGGEDDGFPIAWVDGMMDFLAQEALELGELRVGSGRDVRDFADEIVEDGGVLAEARLP